METSNRTKAIIVGYIIVALSSVSTFLLTHLYIKYLGMNDYGVYQMMNAITQYILLFDFGITTAVMRFRIAALNEKDKTRDENLLFHCITIIFVLILLVVAAGIIISIFIGNIYSSLTDVEVELCKKMMFFITAQISTTLIQHFFVGILMSKEKYLVAKIVDLLRIVAKFVLVTILVVNIKSIMVIVYVDFGITILCTLIVATIVLIRCPFTAKFHYFDSRLLGGLLFLMFSLLLQSVATYINNAADKTILGVMLDKQAVAVYSLAITINAFFASIPNSMGSIFVPQATKMVLNKSSSSELTDLVIKPGRFQFMFCGAVVAGFLLFGKYFMNLWAHETTGIAWTCTIILIIPHLFPLVQNVCLSILTAMNKRLVRSLIVIGTSAINIIITIVLVNYIGLVGAAIGTAVSIVLGNIIIGNVYYKCFIGLEVFRMFKEIFRNTIWCIILASSISASTLFIKCSDLTHLIIGVSSFCIVYAITLLLFGLNKKEKALLLSLVKTRKK